MTKFLSKILFVSFAVQIAACGKTAKKDGEKNAAKATCEKFSIDQLTKLTYNKSGSAFDISFATNKANLNSSANGTPISCSDVDVSGTTLDKLKKSFTSAGDLKNISGELCQNSNGTATSPESAMSSSQLAFEMHDSTAKKHSVSNPTDSSFKINGTLFSTVDKEVLAVIEVVKQKCSNGGGGNASTGGNTSTGGVDTGNVTGGVDTGNVTGGVDTGNTSGVDTSDAEEN